MCSSDLDLESLPQEVLDAVEFDLVKTMDEVMTAVLARLPAERRTLSSDAGPGVSAPHG